jgi:hypothetical protein
MLIFGNGRFNDGLDESFKNVAIGNSDAKEIEPQKGHNFILKYILLEILEWK